MQTFLYGFFIGYGAAIIPSAVYIGLSIYKAPLLEIANIGNFHEDPASF